MKNAPSSWLEKKDRAIAWYGSVIFMILAWLALAGLWVGVIVNAWLKSYIRDLEFGAYAMLAVYLFVLVMIPVQLARYIRERQNGRFRPRS